MKSSRTLITNLLRVFLVCSMAFATITAPLCAHSNESDKPQNTAEQPGNSEQQYEQKPEQHQNEREMYFEIYRMLAPEEAEKLNFQTMSDAEFEQYKNVVDAIAMALMSGDIDLDGDASPSQNDPQKRNEQSQPQNGGQAQPEVNMDELLAGFAQKPKSQWKFPAKYLFGAYSMWRKFFDTYSHNRTYENTTQIPKWLKNLDKYGIKRLGAAAATFEQLQDAGLTSPDAFMMAMATNQNLPYRLQKIYRRAYEDGSYFESRFPLVPQLALKFAPALLYHWLYQNWYNKEVFSEKGGYTQSELRLPSVNYSLHRDEHSSDDIEKGEFSYASQRRYEEYKQGARWNVPLIGYYAGMNEQAAKEKYEEERKIWEENDCGQWRVSTSKGRDKADHSMNLIDSSLYQTAVSSAVDLVSNKIFDKVYDYLKPKIGKKRLTKMRDATYGAVSMNLLWYMCRGVSTCALHSLSNSSLNSHGLQHVLPKFRKDRLGICDYKRINLVKKVNDWGREETDNLVLVRDISYPKYLAKQLGRAMLYNFTSYVVPRLVFKVLDQRKGIAQWIGDKLSSFGNIFVKLGLCKCNPVARVGNAISNQFKNTLLENPQTLMFLIQQFCAAADQMEAQKRMMEGDLVGFTQAQEKMQVYENLLKKLSDICRLKDRLHRFRTIMLKVRSDGTVNKTEQEIDELTREVGTLLEEHGLLKKLADCSAMAGLNYAMPWMVSYAEDKLMDIGKYAADKGYEYAYGEAGNA